MEDKICDDVSKSSGDLGRSLNIHTVEKPYSCPVCGKSFSHRVNCKKHEKIHLGKRFECGVCSGKFTEKGSLKKHMRLHTGENLFSCNLCSRKFARSDHLESHLLTHTGEKPFKCPSCGKSYTQEYTLKLHQTVHEGKEVSCNICNRKFNHQGSFRSHMRKHANEKSFECPVCARKFPSKDKVKRHLQIHTREKPFQCLVCERKYGSKSALKDHSLSHGEVKVLRCSECDKLFRSKSSLRNHIRKHSGDLSFCTNCNKSFASKSSLSQHMKIHLEEPIRCFDCQKVFATLNALKVHRENHACWVKSFKCFFCGRIFARKLNLVRHVKSTHACEEDVKRSELKERPFHCSVCEKNFASEQSRIWHEICVHSFVGKLESHSVLEQLEMTDVVVVDTGSACKNTSEAFVNRNGFEEVLCEGSDEKSTGKLFPENNVFIAEEEVIENDMADASRDSTKSSDCESAGTDSKEDCLSAIAKAAENCFSIKDENVEFDIKEENCGILT